jgi:uncharacterized protein
MRRMAIIGEEKQAEVLRQIEEARALVAGPRTKPAPPSGMSTFFAGIALAIVGGYFLLNQVEVTSSWGFFGLSGRAGFGLTMVPLLIGIGVLFFDGKSRLGWFLSIGGALTIVAAVLTSLSISWQPTSLFNTLAMFGLLAGGVGLVLRSLRPYPPEDKET